MDTENILNYLINISNANLLLNLLNHFIIYFALILFFCFKIYWKNKSCKNCKKCVCYFADSFDYWKCFVLW